MTDMQKVSEAFGFLAKLLKLNGRRLQRAYEESRMRLIVESNPNSPMLTAEMWPRRLRREAQGDKFRPVYGYKGCSSTYEDSFRDTIIALRAGGLGQK